MVSFNKADCYVFLLQLYYTFFTDKRTCRNFTGGLSNTISSDITMRCTRLDILFRPVTNRCSTLTLLLVKQHTGVFVWTVSFGDLE